jgi:hypothetical protein
LIRKPALFIVPGGEGVGRFDPGTIRWSTGGPVGSSADIVSRVRRASLMVEALPTQQLVRSSLRSMMPTSVFADV